MRNIAEKIIEFYLGYNPNKELWYKTFNTSLHTTSFIDEDSKYKHIVFPIQFEEYEVPLLECSFPNGNYVLFTSRRVYSYYRKRLKMRYHEDLIGRDSMGGYNAWDLQNPTEIHCLVYNDNKVILYEIDSWGPGFISTELLRAITHAYGVSSKYIVKRKVVD